MTVALFAGRGKLPPGISHFALARSASDSGGVSEVSISSSVSASRRAQSVLEPGSELVSIVSELVLEELLKLLFFMLQSLSHRNNAPCQVVGFRENDVNDTRIQQTETDPALFAIIKSVI